MKDLNQLGTSTLNLASLPKSSEHRDVTQYSSGKAQFAAIIGKSTDSTSGTITISSRPVLVGPVETRTPIEKGTLHIHSRSTLLYLRFVFPGTIFTNQIFDWIRIIESAVDTQVLQGRR